MSMSVLKLKKSRLFLAAFLCAAVLAAGFFPFAPRGRAAGSSEAADDEIYDYEITFEYGYKFIDPLTGKEAENIFTGEKPAPIQLMEGESFVLPENTIIFRDYVFVCWKYTYTDSEGKKASETYEPGDVYDAVTSDMAFAAVWERPESADLIITGFLYFDKGDKNAEGEGLSPLKLTLGKTIKLPACPFIKDGHLFDGWLTSDGRIIQKGGEYTAEKISATLTATWKRDMNVLPAHTVTYEGGEDSEGEPPSPYVLYKKTLFTLENNPFLKDGFVFVCWATEGGEYSPGDVYDAEGDEEEIIFTAVWAEAIYYFEVSFEIVGPGQVTPQGPLVIKEGETCAFTPVPHTGARLKEVVIGDEKKPLSDSYITDPIEKDILIKLIFEEIPLYSVKLSVSDGGRGEFSDGDSQETFVTEGGEITVNIFPETSYKLSSCLVNGVETVVTDGVLNLLNITSDTVITLSFEKEPGESGFPSEQTRPQNSEPPNSGGVRIMYLIAAITVLLTAAFILLKIIKK